MLLAGCARDPVDPQTAAWVHQLRPLLAENGLLAARVLHAATDVHNGEASPTTAALAWESEIVPLALNLRDQAELVQAPVRHEADHKRLIAIWDARATGYGDISRAIDEGDETRWKRGRSLADKAKLDEEAWFNDVNLRLGPQGIHLDQYP